MEGRDRGPGTGLGVRQHKIPKENKGVFVIFVLQETKNSNLFDKNGIQEYVKYYSQFEESWLRRILFEQVIYKSNYFLRILLAKLCSHIFKASSEEVKLTFRNFITS